MSVMETVMQSRALVPSLLGDVTLALGAAAHASHMSLTVQGAFKHCSGMKLVALISLGFGDYEW